VIPDATITLEGEVQAEGEYQFDLVPGTYDYSVDKDGYVTVSGQVDIVDADLIETVTMVLVTYQLTFQVEDADGNVIPDATITLEGEVQAEGEYQFDLVPGTYDYSVAKDGYVTVSGQVDIVDADLVETVTLVLVTYQLTFQVEDGDGNAIADAVVTLNGEVYGAGQYVFDLLPGEYDYSVTKENYTEAAGQVNVDEDLVLNITIQSTVNVPQLEASEIRLFPNPASDFINIQAESVINEIRVFDLLGQLVFTSVGQDNSFRFNVSDWKNGIYLVQVMTSNGSEIIKVQVSR
jgi:hypothetical protein